jgi:hypothetical protein
MYPLGPEWNIGEPSFARTCQCGLVASRVHLDELPTGHSAVGSDPRWLPWPLHRAEVAFFLTSPFPVEVDLPVDGMAPELGSCTNTT